MTIELETFMSFIQLPETGTMLNSKHGLREQLRIMRDNVTTKLIPLHIQGEMFGQTIIQQVFVDQDNNVSLNAGYVFTKPNSQQTSESVTLNLNMIESKYSHITMNAFRGFNSFD